MSDVAKQAIERLFQHISTGIHVYSLENSADDRTLRLLAANPASLLVVAPASSGAVGLTIDEGFPAFREEGIPPLIAGVVRSGEPASLGVVRLPRADAASISLSIKAFPLGDGCAGVSFEDVTQLARAREAEARRDQIDLQTVLDHVPEIIFVKSAEDLRYVAWNKACADIADIPRERAIGSNDYDLFPAEIAEVYTVADREVLAGGTITLIPEQLVPTSDSGMRISRTRKIPILSEDGRPLFLLGISEDITERKRVEGELRRSREELTSTRNHLLETIRELSTPVLPIHDGILVVPLIGHLDSQRSGQFTESLLAAIQRFATQTVIVDITGVQIVDTAVANHLIQATQAASLLGAECVLVGIAPQIARTMVQLGVEFEGIMTCRDLQAGMAYALARQESVGAL